MKRTRRTCRTAFTLVELIVAGIMIALLASATYVCLTQAVKARDKGASRGESFTRANLAADLIASEVENTLRDSDLVNTRVSIIRDGRPGDGRDGILIFCNSDRPARPGSIQPEGQEYETQFKLQPGADRTRLDLWRRKDPVIDDNPDGGGVATLLVSGISSLAIQASDQTTWRDTWDSDSEGLPYGVKITVIASDDADTSTATARRIVALDRVPIPPQETATETNTTGTTSGTTGSTAR